jgi:hypothetical protein
MNNKQTHLPIIFLSLLSFIATVNISCTDYLNVDEYIDQMTSLDSVFSRGSLLEQYINGAAAYIPNEGNLWTESSTPFQGASDENFTSWNDDRHAAIKFLLDEITPSYTTRYNNYPGYYQGIRMALTVLQRINEVKDISELTDVIYGALLFFDWILLLPILLQYGPVPIVPETLFNVDDPVEKMSLERATYDEMIDAIKKYFIASRTIFTSGT